MLDADRKADGRVGYADAVPHRLGHAGMGGRGGVAGERFRAAERHGELDDFQRVEDTERFRLAPGHVEGERRARRAALLVVDFPLGRALGQVAEIIEARHGRMRLQELRHDRAVAVGAGHAQAERLQRARDHPAWEGVELRADGRAELPHRLHHRRRAERSARDEIRMAPDVLGQRIDRDVGAVDERLLVERAEQRVVADEDRRKALRRADLVGELSNQRDVDQRIERIGGRLRHDDRHAAERARLLDRPADARLVHAVGETDGLDTHRRQRLRDKRLGAAIERLRMQDDVARARIGEDRGGDRRHARGEEERRLGVLEHAQAVLDDLGVRVVEAAVDQPGSLAPRRLAPSRDVIEELLAVLGALEDEGGGEEHRRLDRALREMRVVAVAEHQRLGHEFSVADAVLVVAVLGHRGSLSLGCRRIVAPAEREDEGGLRDDEISCDRSRRFLATSQSGGQAPRCAPRHAGACRDESSTRTRRCADLEGGNVSRSKSRTGYCREYVQEVRGLLVVRSPCLEHGNFGAACKYVRGRFEHR